MEKYVQQVPDSECPRISGPERLKQRICKYCDDPIKSSTKLYYHIQSHLPGGWKCNFCSNTFKRTNYALKHLGKCHNDREEVVNATKEKAEHYLLTFIQDLSATDEQVELAKPTAKKKSKKRAIVFDTPVECRFLKCNFKAHTRGQFDRHISTKHRIVPCACEICWNVFSDTKRAYWHIRRSHEDEYNLMENGSCDSLIRIIDEKGLDKTFIPIMTSIVFDELEAIKFDPSNDE